jgi:hypothetical protein
VKVPTRIKNWSDPSIWPGGKLPVAGDYVEVKAAWELIYDLQGDSPIFKMITINGILRFENTTDRHLRAQHIYVKAGELTIGTELTPFPFNAKITLFGEKKSANIVFAEAIEAGNKLIANTGKISMYGKSRSSQFVRILAEVYPGTNTLKVPPNLDYKPDDILVLAPTSFDWMEDEYLKVLTYN